MAIEIELLAKTVELIKGSKDSAMALDEVRGGLEGVSEEGKQLEETLKVALDNVLAAELEFARRSTQTFDEMTAEQQDAFRARFDTEERFAKESEALSKRRQQAEARVLDEHEQRVKDTYDQVTSTAEESSQKVADYSERGFEKASDAAEGAGDKISDKLGGAFRDLDGTAEGAVTSVAEGLAGLAGTAAGVGGLIGAAAGTAGTLMVREYFKAAEASEERIDNMYKAFLESGQTYYTEAQRLDVVKAFLDDGDAMARAQRVADTLGIPLADAVNALIDKNETNNALLADAVRLRDEEFKNVEDLSTSEQSRLSALETTISFLQTINDEQETSVSKLQLFNQVIAAAPGGFNDLIDSAADLNTELDKTESPRRATVEVEVDLREAERAISEWARRRRRVAVELGIEQGGRIIR